MLKLFIRMWFVFGFVFYAYKVKPLIVEYAMYHALLE